MRFIPTKVHGVIDYLSAAMLLVGPRLLNWDARLVGGATALAIMLTLYSLATRYELGALRLIPMKVHLALDMLSGLLVASLPFWLLRDIGEGAKAVLIGFGLFEVAAGLMTHTSPALKDESNLGTGRQSRVQRV
jgi:hypothetical protein